MVRSARGYQVHIPLNKHAPRLIQKAQQTSKCAKQVSEGTAAAAAAVPYIAVFLLQNTFRLLHKVIERCHGRPRKDGREGVVVLPASSGI